MATVTSQVRVALVNVLKINIFKRYKSFIKMTFPFRLYNFLRHMLVGEFLLYGLTKCNELGDKINYTIVT